MQVYKETIYYWLLELSDQKGLSKSVATLIVGLTIILIALICFYTCRKVLVSLIRRVAQKTATEWDDILVEHKFFHGVSHLVPASIFYFEAGYANDFYPTLEGYILKASNIYFIIAFIIIISSFLNALNEIYNKSFPSAKERPISGVIQLIKIILYFICSLFFVSIIFNKNISSLLTGLGAVAAILILVFKDSILGFVASIQIGMNKLVKVGDYIEIPDKKLDGTVTEINLTCVKIQNSNKTIISLPTYSLVSDSFINWDGMEKSGVRRIQRSVKIDIASIKFCNEILIDSLRNNLLIRDFLKLDESTKNNLTNLGIFRCYLEEYLKRYPTIDTNATLLVRLLQSTENGIPIEINVFTREQRWVEYEKIQTDIFDHILAIIPEFELKVFQHPAGTDIKALITSMGSSS